MTTDDNDFGNLSEEDLPKTPAENIEPAGVVAQTPPPPKPPARSKLSGIGTLLKETWGVFKTRFFTLILIMLLGTLLVVIGVAISFIPVIISKSLAPLTFILACILMIYTMARYYAALYYAITSKDCNVREAFKKTRSKALPFIWIILLQSSVIIGGFCLFFIPGVILSVWLFPALFIFLSEDERGMNSLLKSREYVRGHGFKIFIRLFVSILITMSFGLVPYIGAVLSFVLAPFPLIFAYLLYKELREIKGDFSFKPSGKKKLAFVAVAVIGPFVPVIIAISMIGTAGISMLPMLAKSMTGMQNEMTINMQSSNMGGVSSFKITTTPLQPRDIEADIKTLLNKDKNSFERSQAATSLGNSGSQKAVKPLITALEKDESWIVRQNSADALARLKSDRAVAPLINTLERDDSVFVRKAAATALGNLNNNIAIGPLKKALKDPDVVSTYKQDGSYENVRSVAIAAAAALKKLGIAKEVAAPLVEKISPKKQIEPTTKKKKINKTKVEKTLAVSPKGHTEKPEKKYKKWVKIKYTHKQNIARATNQKLSWTGRTEAVRQLGNSGKAAGAAALVSVLTKDNEPFVRREAATALGKLGDMRAFDALNNALYDVDQSVRENAYAALQMLLKEK
jgi:hypothetical protein